MPTYEYMCQSCNHEWEEYHSILADPIKFCPSCKEESAKRMISGGSGKGRVELGYHEMKEKIKSDARNTLKESSRNENLLANLIGEDRYHRNNLK